MKIKIKPIYNRLKKRSCDLVLIGFKALCLLALSRFKIYFGSYTRSYTNP